MSDAAPRKPDAPNTVEAALGAVLGALHGLTNDQRENVLLAAGALYCLRVTFSNADAPTTLTMLDVERLMAATRGAE